MLRFWLIVATVLCVVMGLSTWSLGAVLPARWLSRGRIIIATLDIASLLLFFGLIRRHDGISETLLRVGVILFSMYWMAKLVLMVLVGIGCALRGVYRFFVSDIIITPYDMERRRLLKGAAALPVAAAAAGVYGGTVGRTDIALREFIVPVPGIDDALDGFCIAQLSDIHLGLFFSLEEWRALLEQAAATDADALAVTGDLFDDDDMNAEAARILDEYVPRFPKGIWFCYGNHEYFRNIEATEEALSKTRVHVLRDESALAVDGARPLWFVGVDYPRMRALFAVDGSASMETAMRGVPKNAVKVLLAHHPDFFDAAAKHNVELALAGHTHGGQLGIFGMPIVPPVFKYMRGVYHVGKTFGYVHSGNGSWFPYRLGCPPEIAVFVLKKK
ncbi:MAG: metallophosphoesterase [Schwartzia sp.]|nr:metallophosphoesterase [Schwartzia sp. (in: firmicutes)]